MWKEGLGPLFVFLTKIRSDDKIKEKQLGVKRVKVIVHRGQHQIGGSIIEIKTEDTKIIFDAGVNLDEDDEPEYPMIPGLFEGNREYDAVFISHYHADHVGLLGKILKDIPVYMGEEAYRILYQSNTYRKKETGFTPLFICHGKSVMVGDMEITPYSCDHSAYDSYMFLIKSGGKTVLYTGDFRANGRMDYSALLNELPEVDAVIIEGTTLSREEARDNISEATLEDIAVKELDKHTGPCFIMMAGTNIDRLITMGNVAKRTGRMLLEDIYTAKIAVSARQENVPKPDGDKVRVFPTDGLPETYKMLTSFGNAKIGKYEIANKVAKEERYIMCVRASMINYIKKLNELQSFEDGVLFYGMWKGYQEKKSVAVFLRYMEEKGVKIHTLHTSGHADEKTIDRLIERIKAKVIIPVHTENERWFDRYKDSAALVYATNEISID